MEHGNTQRELCIDEKGGIDWQAELRRGAEGSPGTALWGHCPEV